MCPYELALKLHELGVNSESEFYFVKEMKGGRTQIDLVTQNTMRYSYRKEGDLIPAYMSHELGEIFMFVTMPTIRQQKCIADLGKQRRSQGRCFSLICWKRRY